MRTVVSEEQIMAQSTTESRNKAHEQAGKAQDAAGRAVEAGKEAVGAVVDRARDAAGDAVKAGQHAAHAVGNAADAATGQVGAGVQNLAQTVRQHGPDSGMLGQATDTVASTLEQGGRYLQEEGLTGMADDLTTLIKRNPIPALLVGVGIGFLLARLTSSRS